MLLKQSEKSLQQIFKMMKISTGYSKKERDKMGKTGQIISYLEVIHSRLRHYSKKRTLVMIDSCGGKGYLSFLTYYYYTQIDPRPIKIYCVDLNEQLMERGERIAEELGFDHLYFHTGDILTFDPGEPVDLVCSLHACDTATDKTLYLGIKLSATHILSVSCCQHTIKKQFRGKGLKLLTQHSIFKDRLTYMAGDAMRALLLEINGYRTDIIEFTSARNSDKNVMLRARRGEIQKREMLLQEYQGMKQMFHITPELEQYCLLKKMGNYGE